MSQPYKTILTIDFETYWDSKTYTLSRMTTEEYVRGDRFKVHGACIHELGSDRITQWYSHEELVRVLKTYDWTKTAVLAHNAQFDIAILSWHYGVQPCFIFDSLSMARALRGVEAGNSLMKLAEDFGLPPKGKAVYSTDGVQDLTPEMAKELAEYCKHDVFLCEQIFSKLLLRLDPKTGQIGAPYPTKELRLIDLTLKMYTRPLLQLDTEMLAEAIEEERDAREGLLQRIGMDEAVLASNPQFAEALRALGVTPPIKVSKTTGKPTLALAKNDALFQALLNGDNEDVALLCEARLKVKSTSERTRAQRFLDIASRGALPVPLSYYGAKSGRYAAAKGSAINMQNLKRGSFLRKAIMAPEGYVLVVGDLSQIEPRVLAWLSDYDDMLDIFRAGGDPYAAFGANMFNIPGMTKDSHPVQRQSAKSAMLGCFGSQTPVLTKRGWVTISAVQKEDLLWDGVEWVAHQGVLAQGEKDVLTAHGISATSDHEILTERGWVVWSEVLQNHSLFQSALLLANSPVFAGSDRQTGTAAAYTTPSCVVRADGKALYNATTSRGGPQRGVIAALKEKLSKRVGNGKGTTKFAQTEHTGIGYSIASAPSSFVVRILTTARTLTTVGAVLPYIRRGWKTVSSFCGTLSALMGGTAPNYSLIGATTTPDTFPAICASSHEARTWPTSAASRPAKSSICAGESPYLKQRMQTYDIALAGPRNRYTILTDSGPLIVHNCGYQLGWASFAQQLLVGFLGAPPVRYDRATAKLLGVSRAYIEAFMANETFMKRMAEIPHLCTDAELLVHCVAAKAIIDTYRTTAYPVVGFWGLCGELIQRSLADGEEYEHKCLLFRKEEIVLPNGMSIQYPNLRQVKDPDTKEVSWVYGRPGDKPTKLYAGKVTNNVTQGLARVVMTDGMLRTAKRYPIAGTVHDEQIAVAPEEEKDEAFPWVIAQMTQEPRYMPGIPLNADGGVHRRYGLAKT